MAKEKQKPIDVGMPVHPLAAIFPMMSDDELDDLAADIKANGQVHPVILDDKGQLVDGRNRVVACKRAGVKPRTEKLNGQSPESYILSVNIARRHMNAGQRAMATAMIYPEDGGKGGRAKKGQVETSHSVGGFGRERLRQARTVLRYSRELAEAVLATNGKSLNEAYDHVQEATAALKGEAAARAQLREVAPDLADQLDAGKLTLREAQAVVAERVRENNEAREHAREAAQELRGIVGHVAMVMGGVQLGETGLIDRKMIAKAIEALETLAKGGK